MSIRTIIHYFLSILCAITTFILSYGFVQHFLTRNLSSTAISEVGKIIINFAVAGMASGIIYIVSFKNGYLPVAVVPTIVVGGPLLAIAALRGEIGGIESATLSARQFAIPVLVGICCAYIGARIVRRVAARTQF